MLDNEKDIVDVKQYGAKGDGLTDDSHAIQKALNTGNDILVSNGIFLIKSAIQTTKDNQKITGNGLIKINNSSLIWSMIKLRNNGSVLNGPGIDNRNAQGAVHISGNNCTVQNCSFIESGYRGYHIFIGSDCKNSVIENNKFTGGNTNEPMVFISHAQDVKILHNHFKDSGSWALHTDNVTNITISENVCENALFDKEITADANQKVFDFDTNNMFAFPNFGILVFSGTQVLKSGFTKTSRQGSIIITFEKGRRRNEIIRCLAFKAAENFNINSRTHNCHILNNRLNNSGDSNITVASDYTGAKLDPRNTKRVDYPTDIFIHNNYLENAFGCNIAISQTNKVSIIRNTCINAGYGRFSTFYNSGIAVPQSIESIIEENSVSNTAGGIAENGILALENSVKTKKFLRRNSISNIKNKYYLGAESDLKDFKSGIYIEGNYKPFKDYTLDQYKNISSIKNNVITIYNNDDGYLGFNFQNISVLRNSLVRFRFESSTQGDNGQALIQVLYKWANNYQAKSISIAGSSNKQYEIYIPFASPQDIIFRLIARKNNSIFNVRNLDISYLSL
ncbi:MAG: glycosyl hydrolase family 28-related protein [Tissierellia bacterium]|nr:glycosyl hydrolase family 28-related protein [Tissierellia bacterium]